MSTFVLIHGAYHGGWCWDEIVPLLRDAGHTVVAPNLPGMGDDPTPHDRITFDSTATAVMDVIAAQAQPVILVGHSMGSTVTSEVAERIPDKVAGLVYVAGILMTEGVTEDRAKKMLEYHPLKVSADGLSVAYDKDGAVRNMYNLTDAAVAERAAARLTPQPMTTVAAQPYITEARFGRVRRAYVECTEDNAIPLTWQRHMQTLLPCDPVFTLNTDHSPFYSAPRKLAECLVAAAQAFSRP